MAKNHADFSGSKNPFYGKKHSAETRDKIKLSRTPEWKAKVSAAVTASNKRRIWTPEMKKNNSDKLKGRIFSEEHRRKISVASKGKTKILTPEWKANIGNAVRGRHHTEETKRILSEKALARYRSNAEYKEKIVRHLARIARPTSIEIILHAIIRDKYPRYKIEHEYQIGQYRVDFAIRSLRIVFEADGIYWHRDKKSDRNRDRQLRKLGWSIRRFSEKRLVSWHGIIKS